MGITTGGKKEENKVLRHLLNKGLITRLVLPLVLGSKLSVFNSNAIAFSTSHPG